MLENTMENGERPQELVIYGGMGKCARNWESYHALVDALADLGDDETLAVQAGMPVAVFATHRLAPRVVMANTNVINATWPLFHELQEQNLTTFSSYTAGPWEYIGSQGVIQGTFETLRAVGKRHFDDSLVGRTLLTAGLGGMGKTQPRAMSMLGGVTLIAEVRDEHIDAAVTSGFCDVRAASLDDAIARADAARARGEALGIALLGNAAEVFPALAERGWRPDVVTEMCPCHDPFSLVPSGRTPTAAAALLQSDRDAYLGASRETMLRLLRAMNRFADAGSVVFEYGTFIRKECMDAGMARAEALRFPGCVAEYVRELFLLGRGPFRWTCLSGERDDQARLDQLVLDLFPDDEVVQRWIPLARDQLPIEGLPARVCFLGFGQRRAFAHAANELVASGELAAPIAFSRDNLDCGSIANPAFETEAMRDGSDVISDWPYLNALLNVAAMADLVAIQANGAMGMSAHTGVTMIADGTEEASLRLDACLTTDAGIGVVRHAQAGYALARRVADGQGPLTSERIAVPLWWSPKATFGPGGEDGQALTGEAAA
jgi:urocanate hydratase